MSKDKDFLEEYSPMSLRSISGLSWIFLLALLPYLVGQTEPKTLRLVY